MKIEKAYNACITVLESFSLTEDDVRDYLNKDKNEELTDEDWISASERYIQSFIDCNSIPQVNDVDIELT